MEDDSINSINSLKRQTKKKLCLLCQFKTNLFNWCNKCKSKHFKLVYGGSPSGNDIIDEVLKSNYSESKKEEDIIEWIPYSEFRDITHIFNENYSSWYSATWMDGRICDWDKDRYNWIRNNEDIKVMLKIFTNVNDYKYHLKYNYSLSAEERLYRNVPHLYGISMEPRSLNYILVFNDKSQSQNLCVKCQFLRNFFNWCEDCKLKHFEITYGQCPCGNDEIDEMLKKNYCKSKNTEELIEWIPYSEFKGVTHVDDEESSNLNLFKAIWPNGNIHHLDNNKLDWKRVKDLNVTLKNFESLDDLFNYKREFELHYSSLSASDKLNQDVSQFYGISQDPVSNNFILVL